MTSLMERWYRKRHPGQPVHYKYKCGLWTIFTKPIRKWFSAVLAPAIPYTGLRMWLYLRCGDKIGKGVYMYKVRVRNQNNEIAEKIEKHGP